MKMTKKVASKAIAFIVAFAMVATLIPTLPASAAITGIEISIQSSPGEFTVTMGNETWTTMGCGCEGGVEGKKVKDAGYTSIGTPVRSGKTFQGWAVYEYRGNSLWEKVSASYLTSEEVLNYVVPNCGIMFQAKWNGEALGNYIGNTVGYEGGIQGNGGEFDVTCNGEKWRTGGCSQGAFDEGASLRDMGYTKVENITHPEGLYLKGWYPYVTEGVLSSSNWKKISGAKLLSTAEMLDYKITGQSTLFFAQWGETEPETSVDPEGPSEPDQPSQPEQPTTPDVPTTPDDSEKPLTECEANGHRYSVTSIKKATMTDNGTLKEKCSVCGETKTTTIYRPGSVDLSTTKYTYNGSAKKPSVTVKDVKGNTISSKYYSVSYAKGRKTVGRYKVTVTFKTRYTGSKAAYFTIVPKAPSSASAVLYGYDDIKFSWKKSTGAKGYSIYYKSGAGSYKLLKRTTATSVKKANLSDGVKYTFKVVPYYKSGSTIYESTASKTSSVYTLKKMSTPAVEKYSNTKVKVKWTDIEGQSGYQISQSTSKTGTKIVATYGTTSGQSKVFKATKNKKYYYKVRAYKTVSGKKIYGPWSSVKAYTLSDKVETVTININMDNVNQYFEVKELVSWRSNVLGEVTSLWYEYHICLKDEYVKKLAGYSESVNYDEGFSISNDSRILFEYKWDNKRYYPTVDYDKKTYRFVESDIPASEYENKSKTEECFGWFDKESNHWIVASGGCSYSCIDKDDNHGEDYTVLRKTNFEFTRAQGTLVLTK